jgi:microcystin-dependent protein
MAVNTTTYSFLKPIVGGDVNLWGGYLNDNSDKLDDLFDGTASVAGIDINGGSIDGTPIGAAVASTGAFSALTGTTIDGPVGSVTPAAGTFSNLVATTADINAGTFDGVVGGTTPAAGTFSNLVATTADINAGTFDGVVGGTTPAAGTFSNLVATTADINAGTFDGVVGGTTPAAGTFTTLYASNFVGLVAHFAVNTAPTGWLKANGAAVSRTTYSALFAVIGTTFGSGDGSTTFNVPDLRGEFIRGMDDGRGVDSGRVFGSAQTDQNASHTHQITRMDIAQAGASSGRVQFYEAATGKPLTLLVTGTSGGTEARPRSIALSACIKF